MKVQEVMTTDVLTVGPEAPLKDVAKLLVERSISGVPVCGIEGRVLGVISEADILVKAQGAAEPRTRLARLLEAPDDPKASALVAADAMTAPPITIAPFRRVDEAARLMTEHGVNRLPVVARGELVGIVTRADLVRAFTRGDREIEHEIESELLGRTLWLEPGAVRATAVAGRVLLRGRVQTRSDAGLLERLAGRVAGVVSVESELEWAIDDTTRRGRRALAQAVR